MKAREEKYKSRIRVLEALASGTSGQTHVNSSATNGKTHVNFGDGDINISSRLQLELFNLNDQPPYIVFLIVFQVSADHVHRIKVCFSSKIGCFFIFPSFAYILF